MNIIIACLICASMVCLPTLGSEYLDVREDTLSYLDIENLDGDISEPLGLMEPAIHSYAYLQETGDIDLSSIEESRFWNVIRYYAIFKSQYDYENNLTNPSPFRISVEDIQVIAYSLFDDFTGVIPMSYIDDGEYIITPATPEQQKFELISYTKNDDNSVDAVYSLSFLDVQTDSYKTEYTQYVHLVPSDKININSHYRLYYRIDTITSEKSAESEINYADISDYARLLPGSWYQPGYDYLSFIFYDDGTCKIHGDYGLGTWSVVNGNVLKISDYYGITKTAVIEYFDSDKQIMQLSFGGYPELYNKYTGNSASSSPDEKAFLVASYKKLIPGSWYLSGDNHLSYTFYDDGTCKLYGEYGVGTWSVVNGNVLKISDYYGLTKTATIDYIDSEKQIMQLTVAGYTEKLNKYTGNGASSPDENASLAASYRQSLPGSWYLSGDNHPSFILYDDGTCKIYGEYGQGLWSVVNGNIFKVISFYGELETETIDFIDPDKGMMQLHSGRDIQVFYNKPLQ